jgi:hypothetical protein
MPDLGKLSASWPGDFGFTCLLVTALARCGRHREAADACLKALTHAQEHGLDVTPHHQLQYDVLNGNIPASRARLAATTPPLRYSWLSRRSATAG